jgi:hypothetical protein
LREDHGETRTDARTSRDEHDRFEQRGDAKNTTGGDAADVDVRWGALDGTTSEVACTADDEGEAFLASGVGDGCEAVPDYNLVQFILRQ